MKTTEKAVFVVDGMQGQNMAVRSTQA